jgi:cyanophycinase
MKRGLLLALALACFSVANANAASYQYFRIGNKQDVQVKPAFGIAMMGGGKDLDEAFRWLCAKGNGGDLLVLRATGDDDYNPYINGLCNLNSVATLIIPNLQAAKDPAVARIIRKATIIFISGGDQANYIRGWQGSPVQDAINADIEKGKPIGGTSAGLAVLGEFVYGALGDKPDDPDLTSKQVLNDPYFDRVTLVRDFLKIPQLNDILTDSHFATRDRMGRSLGFLARLVQDGWSASPREVAIDERSAVLVEPDGIGTVVGSGKGAYFMHATQAPETCKKGLPLTVRNIAVYHLLRGGQFNVISWKGEKGDAYSLSVANEKIQSTQRDGSVY